MMSILNLHQELPRDRVQLYEQASRVLLHQWDVERLGLKVTLDYKEKAEMLRRLALEMQSAPGGLKGNIIAGDKLEALFRDYFKQELEHPDPRNAAREMVQQLRERNYILCLLGQDNFAFRPSHAARIFLRLGASAPIAARRIEPRIFETAGLRPHWRTKAGTKSCV
jgi:predicted NACHT family NTPase